MRYNMRGMGTMVERSPERREKEDIFVEVENITNVRREREEERE